ncbi:dephospho-CoA kinase [Peptococcaceae bacterium 1198_IL3148]
MMNIIGLTGGIGSGKTTVANHLARLGAQIIDADLIAREIVTPNSPALKEIVATFGPGVLHTDGTLNRKQLGAIVFGNELALAKLNAITHPKITAVVRERINQFKRQQQSGKDMLVLVAPLLIEVGLDKLVDKVWLVHVSLAEQLQRIMERDGLSKEQALQRINSQLSETERMKYADEIIDNSQSLEYTLNQVTNLWIQYTCGDSN